MLHDVERLYVGDPWRRLAIVKRRGYRCEGDVARRNFCLTVDTNPYNEWLNVFSVGRGCSNVGCYAPCCGYYYTGIMECTYVLPPSDTYILAYAGSYPRPLAIIKKFRVTDPEHAEVLGEWECYGYDCIRKAVPQSGLDNVPVPEAVEKVCNESDEYESEQEVSWREP